MYDQDGDEDRGLLDEFQRVTRSSHSSFNRGLKFKDKIWAGAKCRRAVSASVLTVSLLSLLVLGCRYGFGIVPNVSAIHQLAIPLHPDEHAKRDAKTLEFFWNVTVGSMAPDGVQKQVYLVNGLSVRLKNHLT